MSSGMITLWGTRDSGFRPEGKVGGRQGLSGRPAFIDIPGSSTQDCNGILNQAAYHDSTELTVVKCSPAYTSRKLHKSSESMHY